MNTEQLLNELTGLKEWQRQFPTKDKNVKKAQELWRKELLANMRAQVKKNGHEQ